MPPWHKPVRITLVEYLQVNTNLTEVTGTARTSSRFGVETADHGRELQHYIEQHADELSIHSKNKVTFVYDA